MMPWCDLGELGQRLKLSKGPRSWRGNCPACDYRGAFSMKAGKRGDVLAYCANGCPQSALDVVLQQALGRDWTPRTPAPDGEIVAAQVRKQMAALRMWSRSTAVPSTPADQYLAGRALSGLTKCKSLRFLGDCWHEQGCKLPAMIALVLDVSGQPIAVHRTYLTRDGKKAVITPVKSSLGPVGGGAVRLTSDPTPLALVIGEGIETSASAGLLFGLPAWAALFAGNLSSVLLPPEVRAVTIAADADVPGARGARDAARRWRAEGRHVQIATPNVAGQDFNDLLLNRVAQTPGVNHG